jgi:hypothetical protein
MGDVYCKFNGFGIRSLCLKTSCEPSPVAGAIVAPRPWPRHSCTDCKRSLSHRSAFHKDVWKLYVSSEFIGNLLGLNPFVAAMLGQQQQHQQQHAVPQLLQLQLSAKQASLLLQAQTVSYLQRRMVRQVSGVHACVVLWSSLFHPLTLPYRAACIAFRKFLPSCS